MDKVRVRYSKIGRARYISHLDLVTVMQRALLRAGVSLKYSEGFNPHPHISVALPASVGVESVCELMDVALSGGGIPADISKYLPEGIEIQKTYRPWRNVSEIKWLDVQCRVRFSHTPPQFFETVLNETFAKDSLLITKKTKRGSSVIDIAPHICDVKIARGLGDNAENDAKNDTDIVIFAKISAQNPTIGLKDITGILEGLYADFDAETEKFDTVEMKRIELFDTNMLLFK